jgi:hypothetical protein
MQVGFKKMKFARRRQHALAVPLAKSPGFLRITNESAVTVVSHLATSS